MDRRSRVGLARGVASAFARPAAAPIPNCGAPDTSSVAMPGPKIPRPKSASASSMMDEAVMLIEFQVTNYRSFRDHQVFSMVAGRFTEHTDANTVAAGIPGFDRFLRTSVIYGANAAGKTNLLRALQLTKREPMAIQPGTTVIGGAPIIEQIPGNPIRRGPGHLVSTRPIWSPTGTQ
jgi:hypothetical protein